jgi:general secretion pathway protein I
LNETKAFTLLEVLAALAIIMAGLAAIGALEYATLRSTLHAEQHLAQISAARRIMASLPTRKALPFGRLTGVLDGNRWRADSTRVAAEDSTRDAAWIPQGIVLLVRSPSGSTIEIDTIRLRRQRTK